MARPSIHLPPVCSAAPAPFLRVRAPAADQRLNSAARRAARTGAGAAACGSGETRLSDTPSRRPMSRSVQFSTYSSTATSRSCAAAAAEGLAEAILCFACAHARARGRSSSSESSVSMRSIVVLSSERTMRFSEPTSASATSSSGVRRSSAAACPPLGELVAAGWRSWLRHEALARAVDRALVAAQRARRPVVPGAARRAPRRDPRPRVLLERGPLRRGRSARSNGSTPRGRTRGSPRRRLLRDLADLLVDDVADHRHEHQDQPVAQAAVAGCAVLLPQSSTGRRRDALRCLSVCLLRSHELSLAVDGATRTVPLHRPAVAPGSHFGARRRAPRRIGRAHPLRSRRALPITGPRRRSAVPSAMTLRALAGPSTRPRRTARPRGAACAQRGARARARRPRRYRELFASRARSRTSTGATGRAARCSRPASRPRAAPSRAAPRGRFVAVALARACDLLERGAARAARCSTTPASRSTSCGALDGARGAVQRRRCASIRSLPHVEATSTQLAARRRAVRRPRDAGPVHRADRARRAGARCRARRRPARRQGLTLSLCMIVRDEEEMLPRCLAAAAAAVDELIDRRHRLDRPHDRDRALVRRARDRARVDRARSPRRATSPSTRRPATGSCTSTPTRCSSPRTSAAARAHRAAPGARRSTWSRPTSPATSTTAPRSRTTRCACSATAPSTASRAACTSRSATRCRATCPSGSSRPGPRRALRLPRRGARRQGEVAAQHRAAARAAAREPRPPFLHFNLGSEYAAAGDAPRCARGVRARVVDAGVRPGPRPLRVHARHSSRGWSRRCASCGRPAGRDRARPATGLAALPGLHRPRASSRRSLRSRSAESSARERRSSAASRWATRPPLHRDRRLRQLPAAIALAELQPGPATYERRRAARLALRRRPRFLGTVLPYASGAAARASSPPTRSSPARGARSAVTALATVRLLLATALTSRAPPPRRRRNSAGAPAQPHSARALAALGEALLAQRSYEQAADVAAALAAEDRTR